jgi:hypothetical protein
MSNTRRAMQDGPISQERYMSSPEYADLRGINGHAVTAKAMALSSPRKRSLLFFIQGMSLEIGGLPQFAAKFLDAFPERIGSPTMLRAGKAKYTLEQRRQIGSELGWGLNSSQLAAMGELDGKPRLATPVDDDVPAAELRNMLRAEIAERLPGFLLEMCINPSIEFHEPGEPENADNIADITDREEVLRRNPRIDSDEFRPAMMRHFKDIVGALFEYQQAYSQTEAPEFEETSVSRLIFRALDEALKHPDRVYALEGMEGIGKTHAAKLWCKRNAGRARYVSLSGATNKTAIFRAISRALGLGAGAHKSSQMQARVEDMLQRGKLMLVIDEAAYLLPQSERIYSRPEMLDWVYSALANFGVPSLLLCTPVFAKRVSMAEQQTVWNSRQFRRRCKFQILPSSLPEDDLARVAARLMPECGKREAAYVTNYGITAKWPLTSIVAAIEEARDMAMEEGRKDINFAYLRRAIKESRMPSDDAQARAFQPAKKGRRMASAADLQPDFSGPERGRNVPAESTADATEGRRISAELLGA